ncbi:hypothetical protein BLOT_010044 [Blomia tropicalis]|nr:hypothetical protein BLOT_010044 [Blomia tropicalis]
MRYISSTRRLGCANWSKRFMLYDFFGLAPRPDCVKAPPTPGLLLPFAPPPPAPPLPPNGLR